ncbi:MAG: tetratricopeptide repeat protein [Gemmatimonadaceae bacterium]
MNTRRVTVAVVLLAGALAAGALSVTRITRTSPPATSAAPASGFSELALRDEQIAVWKTALDADSVSALAMGQLAALYMQRAREGGSYDDYGRAEQYARKSMGTRMNRNGKTAVTLVSVLLAQHRFTEARDVASDLVDREGDVPQYRTLLGEVSMEVGDYATAGIMFDSVWSERAHLSNAPRLARWLELNNHTREARRILVDARNEAIMRRDVTKETQAWFELRLGDFDLRAGRPRAAEESFRAGLKIEPNDPRLLAAMARLSSENREYRDAIEWGERAIAEQLDPATLGIVGDAYAAVGDTAKATEYFHTLEVAVTAQPGAYHRAWSLYLLDHDLRVPDVLDKAQEELKQRKDIYGYDLVAWALYKSGRVAEANVMMKQALQLNTPDPLLMRHQAAIAKALPTVAAAH